MIYRYVRDSKNNPIGVVGAVKDEDNGDVVVAWSKCKQSWPGDRFDREKGLAIVLNRVNSRRSRPVPMGFNPYVCAMAYRAHKYFRVPLEEVIVL